MTNYGVWSILAPTNCNWSRPIAATCHFDLLVTDIDMPRMDGIELVARIKKDPNLKCLPVMMGSGAQWNRKPG